MKMKRKGITMPLSNRNQPYIWVTWLTKLLTGADSCEWATWFKSHFTFEQESTGFDIEGWERLHTEYMQITQEEIYNTYGPEPVVTVEGENSFKVEGKSGIIIAGKPDIILRHQSENSVYDVKTGNPQPFHKTQLLIYMWALPQLPEFKGVTFDGVLAYKDHMVHIPASDLTGQFIGQLIGLIKRVGSAQEALKVSSSFECGNCKITINDCPEKKTSEMMKAMSGDF